MKHLNRNEVVRMLLRRFRAGVGLLLLLTLLCCFLPPAAAADGHVEAVGAAGFSDTKGHWAWAWIELAHRRGLISGVSQTQFAPDAPLARSMVVTLLYRTAGTPNVSLTTVDENGETVRKHYFSDVPEGKWFERPVIWAYENGLIAGTGEGLFSPNEPTTREQMCFILKKFAGLQGKTLSPQIPKTTFADDAEISAWAKDAVYLFQRCRLVAGVGDGKFAPKRPVKRAEATVLLVGYLRQTGQLPPKANLVNPAQDIDDKLLSSMLTELAIEYPGLIRVSSAGTSCEGRDIPMVKFGKGSRYLYTEANIHAKEHQTTNFVMEVLDEYAYAYETTGTYDGYNIRALLQKYTMVILPRVNPDGANIAQKGFDAAKTPAALRAMIGANQGASQWKSNARGVDLNRNFPCYWAPVGTGPANKEYGGPYAASEPETKAVVAAMNRYQYDYFLDIHMAGNAIYFCNTGIDNTFYAASKAFAQRLCNKTGLKLAYSKDVKSDHTAAAYARDRFRHPALTVELTASTVFPHNSGKFYTEIWPYVKDLYLEAMSYQ